MYTQCPECHARFRVGAADLGAAGGTVRCGRCGSGFNALASLSDTLPPALGYTADRSAPDESDVPRSLPHGVFGVEFHFTAEDIESVFVEPGRRPGRSVSSGSEAERAEPSSFGTEPPEMVVGENQSFEDITLEGERISIESILGIGPDAHPADEDEPVGEDDPTDEYQLLRDVPDSAYPEYEDSEMGNAIEPASEAANEEASSAETDLPLAEEIAPPASAAATGDRFESRPIYAEALDELLDTEPEPMATRGRALEAEPSLAAVLEPERASMRPSRASVAWLIGCLVVALVLLAQVTHHFRQDLVRHPQIGPLIKDVYARIGMPLSPNWDLPAFELRQWGNDDGSDAAGRLTVRASIVNRAAFAQPHPILRLELDDRFGGSVAVRDFAPAEYLKNPSEAARLLGPGASAEAELVIVDSGKEAVGYQLDVCMRESATILRCAQGPG
jgi:predicted Zn finger-like uncharacterized protein